MSVSVRRPPSPLVFFHISTHFTATRGILPPSTVLQFNSFGCSPHVKHGNFTSNLSRHLRALYAQSFRLTLAPSVLPRLLARSLPVLIHTLTSNSAFIYTLSSSNAKCFTTRRPSSHTRHGCIRVSPIVQYSPLLPPVGVWSVSQFQCG